MDKLLLKINNKLLKIGNYIVCMKIVDPYNPLNLPPNTVRVRTSDGDAPAPNGIYDSATLVPGTTDVYDVFKDSASFKLLFLDSHNVVEVLGANTTNVTNMNSMFLNCNSLTSVPLFDTSNVTDMHSMFQNCSSLTIVPLYDTSNVTEMGLMFQNCASLTIVPLFDTSNVTEMPGMFDSCAWVQSGALALYQQASTQSNPPSNHTGTFHNCGSNTETGAAELSQIPSDWK